MAFMDPEKAISALQALQAGPAMRKFNDALGTTAEAVANDAHIDVSERIRGLFGDAMAEAYMNKQGIVQTTRPADEQKGKHSA